MNHDEIKNAIASFVTDITGLPAFKEYEPRDYTLGPYFIIDIPDEKTHGRDERHIEHDEDIDMLTRHTEGQRGFTVSFNCYSENETNSSARYISNIIDALGLESTLEYFAKHNLAIITIGSPTSIPFYEGDRIVRLTNVDVSFGTAVTTADKPVDYFETFEMNRA